MTASTIDSIIQIASSSVGTAVVSAIVAAVMYWFLAGRQFKREQQINYLKERLDTFYSPLIFHFANMRSWADFRKSPQGYIWAETSLIAKIDDMNNLMRSGMRFVSSTVEKLWYKWQPLAVAAVHKIYPEFNLDDLLSSSQNLHEALLADRENLMKKYKQLVGDP